MLGFENMLKDMIGINPAELRQMMENATAQGQQIVNTLLQQNSAILTNQQVIHHKQLRIEKMLESIMRERGLEIPNEEINDGPKQLPN